MTPGRNSLAKDRRLDRVAVIRYSFRMIFLVGLMGFIIRPLFADAPVPLMGRVLIIHLVGALFIPWTVREAFKILLGLCGLALISDFLFVQGTLGVAAAAPWAIDGKPRLSWFLLKPTSWSLSPPWMPGQARICPLLPPRR